MSEVQYLINEQKKPGFELTKVSEFIFEGGAIARIDTIKIKIPKCFVLITARNDGKLVGTAALKNDQEYARNCFSKRKANAQAYFDNNKKWLDLGYIHVAENERGKGYARELVSRAIEQFNTCEQKANYSVFATTHSDSMKSILECNSFKQVGEQWLTDDRQNLLCLFVLC